MISELNFVGGDESTEKFPPEDTSKSASNSPVSDLPVSDFSVSNFSRTGETGRKGKADGTPVSGFPIAPGAASRLSVFQDFLGKNLWGISRRLCWGQGLTIMRISRLI